MKKLIPILTLSLVSTTAVPVSAAEDALTVPVTVTRSVSKPLQITATAQGELESPANPVIAAEVEGQVMQLQAQDGDAVDAQQILATLDPEPYDIALDSAKASVARLEAVVQNQQLTVSRLKDLRRRQSSAQSDLDKARTDLAAGRAELTAAKANMRNARYQLDKASIRSPAKGVVQKRYISVGSYVKKGDPVFQIVATDALTARLYIPESLADKMQPGLPVELHAGGDSHIVHASITRLLPALDPDNRALAAMVDFNNEYQWRPGASIDARITLNTVNDAVMVPVRSVVRRPAGSVVYRIENGKAIAQNVELGTRSGNEVEITSGLDADSTIALDGAGFLTDGAAVEVRERKQ